MALVNPTIETLLHEAVNFFQTEFKSEPIIAVCAPGRVNLIGEHTDYNAGFVLPMALPLTTIMVGSKTNLDMARVATNNSQINGMKRCEFTVKQHLLEKGEPKWANYVKGVVAFFPCNTIPGFDAVIVSSVPTGGGLSSSASLEVATYTFLEALTNTINDSLTDKALVCQKAEHIYAGMPCGLMDQFISTHGKKGFALLLDCKSHNSELIPLSDSNIVVLIINSNVHHELTGSEYPLRKQQCIDAAKALNVSILRDATVEDIKKLESLSIDPQIIKRGRHVITEIKRTEQAAQALKNNDYKTFGQLMVDSHKSLRDDFEVSCPELDSLVELALEMNGVYGSRMTGGGFGGCTVTLVHKDSVTKVIENVKNKFKGVPNFYICSASDGAKILNIKYSNQTQ